VSEAAIAQRIVRAKKTLAAARVPFEEPDAAQRIERLASVFEGAAGNSVGAHRLFLILLVGWKHVQPRQALGSNASRYAK
jgi:hypothetical protein